MPVHFCPSGQSCRTVSQTGGQRCGSVHSGSPRSGAEVVALDPAVVLVVERTGPESPVVADCVAASVPALGRAQPSTRSTTRGMPEGRVTEGSVVEREGARAVDQRTTRPARLWTSRRQPASSRREAGCCGARAAVAHRLHSGVGTNRRDQPRRQSWRLSHDHRHPPLSLHSCPPRHRAGERVRRAGRHQRRGHDRGRRRGAGERPDARA